MPIVAKSRLIPGKSLFLHGTPFALEKSLSRRFSMGILNSRSNRPSAFPSAELLYDETWGEQPTLPEAFRLSESGSEAPFAPHSREIKSSRWNINSLGK
jgi:hypothetical protein